MITKDDIRREALVTRTKLPFEKKEEFNKCITDILISLDEYRKAQNILFYASYNSEVDTYRAIEYSLNNGKEVYLPKSYFKDNKPMMDFYRINSIKDLVAGFKGIPEPDTNKCECLCNESPGDLMIMPGVAFDKLRHRIGYGKGFYDNYLTKNSLFTVALGYECQVYRDIPAEPHDIFPNILITEKGIYR